MKVEKQKNGEELTFVLEGQLNTSTAPILDSEISSIDEDVKDVVFDVRKLKYISSAGLRILLMVTKKVKPKKGRVIVRKPNFTVENVLESTGLTDLLEIEH